MSSTLSPDAKFPSHSFLGILSKSHCSFTGLHPDFQTFGYQLPLLENRRGGHSHASSTLATLISGSSTATALTSVDPVLVQPQGHAGTNLELGLRLWLGLDLDATKPEATRRERK